MPSESRDVHVALGPGREFDLIRTLVEQWGSRATGIGDDAAILNVPAGQQVVVSTDTSVEDVHFRRAWATPREIGWRAAVAALSDLAAMAAEPLGTLVAMVLPPERLSIVEDLAAGIGEAVASCHAPIIGGDISKGPTLALCITVLGSAIAPLRRSGAREGDRLYVTGRLGAPGAALRALESGTLPNASHLARFLHPRARMAEGQWLARAGAHAMIDISDGLASEARHLAAASRVGIEIALDDLPVVDGVTAEDAARSGEEYELMIVAPTGLDTLAFERRFDLSLRLIGRVASTGAARVDFTRSGRRVDLALGYEHFSS